MKRTFGVFLFALATFVVGYGIGKIEAGCTVEVGGILIGPQCKSESGSGGWYEIYKDKSENREWRWRLKAKGGEIIAQGEGFTSKSGVEDAIGRIRKYAPCSPLTEIESMTR